MEWKRLTKIEAADCLSKYQDMGLDKFLQECQNLENSELPEEYKTLRKELVTAYQESKSLANDQSRDKSKLGYSIIGNKYRRDVLFGIKVYSILKTRGMNVRYASNSRIWSYIAVKVIPDLVYDRYGEDDYKKKHIFRLNKERYYDNERRIFPLNLWWYIYLAMKKSGSEDDLEATANLLLNSGSTDTIVQIVERSGREGYRVDLSRELLEQYCGNSDYGPDAFRKVMVLNSARTRMIEPKLRKGGYDKYVKELFDYFAKSEDA